MQLDALGGYHGSMGDGRIRFRHSVGFLLACVLVIGFTGAFGVWNFMGPTPEIRFVLPRDFKGGFIVVEDAAGVDLGRRLASVTLVTVPESRVVKVKSFAPFKVWHRASIQMGKDGPISNLNLDPADDAIELRGGGLRRGYVNGVQYRERIRYVFGTDAEATAFDPYSIPADPSEQMAGDSSD